MISDVNLPLLQRLRHVLVEEGDASARACVERLENPRSPPAGKGKAAMRTPKSSPEEAPPKSRPRRSATTGVLYAE